MRRPFLFLVLALLGFGFASGAKAQDLFLKKGSSGPAPTEDGEKPAPKPLFLESPSSSVKAAPAAKPLFLDQPGSRTSGTLYRPTEKSGKIFELQRKDPGTLTPAEKHDLAMDKTRQANLVAIQQESARLQAKTSAALAQWQAETNARQAADAAAEAAQAAALSEPLPPPADAPQKPPARKLVYRPAEDKGDGTPRPVFNTER
jgi:hypothetical protein